MTGGPDAGDPRALAPTASPEALPLLRAEHDAVLHGAALLEAPWEALLTIDGPEAEEFLQGLLTQDIAGLAEGRTAPAALADRKGHWTADLWVHRTPGRFRLRLRRDRVAAVIDVFERHLFSTRAHWRVVEDRSAFLLLGPAAPAALRATGVDIEEGRREGGELEPLARGEWLRVRDTGPTDLVLHIHPEDAEAARAGLAATPAHPRPVAWDAYNLARIEAGTPWHGLDGDEDRIVPEVVPADRISLRKGCYLGQETIARVHYRGQVRRVLARLRLEGTALPAVGTELFTADGRPAGTLRSAALHPDGGVIALALRTLAPLAGPAVGGAPAPGSTASPAAAASAGGTASTGAAGERKPAAEGMRAAGATDWVRLADGTPGRWLPAMSTDPRELP